MSLIKVHKNTHLYYKDHGTGKPILFVHGWCINSDSWEYMMNDLCSAGFRCIAYDQRGCGRSDQPWDGYNYRTLADDLAEIIDQLDLTDLTLVGHSMGCGVITQYLADYGSVKVSNAVLIGTTTPLQAKTDDNEDGIDPVCFDQTLATLKADRPAYIRGLVDGFYDLSNPNVSVSADLIDWSIHITLQASAPAAAGMLATNFYSDQRAQLAKISTPVLLLHGDKDVSCPPALTALPTYHLLQNSKLQIFEGEPHGMYISKAGLLTQPIIDFINRP
ncbi:MAG: alpha/beta fold hydrolase [Mucilaginibacter sp.]